MGFWIALLTVLLLIDCLLLILLVIIQLPKKEVGLGIAFGGAAADALFGPGSGTILTKTTKYLTVVFFVLTLMLASLHLKQHRSTRSAILKATGATEEAIPVRGRAQPGVLPQAAPTTPLEGSEANQGLTPQPRAESKQATVTNTDFPQQ